MCNATLTYDLSLNAISESAIKMLTPFSTSQNISRRYMFAVCKLKKGLNLKLPCCV